MWTKNQMNGVAQGLGILDSHVRSHAIEGHCPHSQPRGQPVISNAPRPVQAQNCSEEGSQREPWLN